MSGKQKPYEMWQAEISLAAWPLANFLAGFARERIWRLRRRSPAHEFGQLRSNSETQIVSNFLHDSLRGNVVFSEQMRTRKTENNAKRCENFSANFSNRDTKTEIEDNTQVERQAII